VASRKTDLADSSDQAGPGTDVGLVEDGEVYEGEVALAAQRAADFIQRRGFGPATVALVMYIAETAVDTADLNVVIMEQLAVRLMNAQSIDDILQPFAPQSGKDHYGKPLYIEDAGFIESDHEGFPWYTSLQCKNPATGEQFNVTVGGEKVVMQAAAFHRAGLFPAYVRIVESEKPTKAGYYPLELVPAVPGT